MTLSASVTGRSNVLRTRLDDLTERERQLLDALQEVRAGIAKTRGQLQETERARDRARRPTARAQIAEETWRRVMRQLGTFTMSELRAELECSAPTASNHVKAMIASGIVQPAGRVMGKALFEYVEHVVPAIVEPAPEAVEALRVHRRQHLQPVPEPERGVAVEGTGRRGVNVADADVRQACQEAERRGWKLSKKGDGHFVLVKGARRVPVSGTPRSGSQEAKKIRSMTRER